VIKLIDPIVDGFKGGFLAEVENEYGHGCVSIISE
jgi:hypothetical protein